MIFEVFRFFKKFISILKYISLKILKISKLIKFVKLMEKDKNSEKPNSIGNAFIYKLTPEELYNRIFQNKLKGLKYVRNRFPDMIDVSEREKLDQLLKTQNYTFFIADSAFLIGIIGCQTYLIKTNLMYRLTFYPSLIRLLVYPLFFGTFATFLMQMRQKPIFINLANRLLEKEDFKDQFIERVRKDEEK